MIERLLELLGLTGSEKFHKTTEIYKDGELQRRIVHHSENWSEEDTERMKKMKESIEEAFEELDMEFGELDDGFREMRNRRRRRKSEGR